MLKYFIIFSFLMACGSHKEADSSGRFGFYQKNSGSGGIQIFGDSIFATSNHRIKSILEGLAKVSIKDSSVSGSKTNEISEQYRQARGESIKTVIRDGGGNDVFGDSDNCRAFNDACKRVVDEGMKNYKKDFTMMTEDGVHNIILLGFHYPQGWMSGFEKVIDYTMPLIENLCEDSVVPCVLIDPREKFKSTGGLLEWDGVHPNAKGCQVMAEMIFEKMK